MYLYLCLYLGVIYKSGDRAHRAREPQTRTTTKEGGKSSTENSLGGAPIHPGGKSFTLQGHDTPLCQQIANINVVCQHCQRYRS